jgi:hypothetical protein
MARYYLRLLLILAATGYCIIPEIVFAQEAAVEYSTSGLQLLPLLVASRWSADELDINGESGSGGGIGVGYGFGNRFGVLVNFAGATINEPDIEETYPLSYVDLGVRATIGSIHSRLKFIVDALVSGVRS